jgi:hypothetical protein
LSKPHVRRIAATVSGVEVRPTIRCAGSPFGIAWKIRNVSTKTNAQTGFCASSSTAS